MSNEAVDSKGPSGDLIVVGGGIIGLSCAWRAAQAGLEVTVVDAGGAERASDVAAGMIAPVGEAAWGEEATLDAALGSARRWPGFAADLERASGTDVPYRRCGSVHVALDRDELAELRRVHVLHGELELESEWLTASACRRIEPGLATGVVGGYLATEEAEVDPRAVLGALRPACRDAGVRTVEDRVGEVLMETGHDRVAGVVLAEGRVLQAPRVLLAAGARIAALAPAGVDLPVRPLKGEMIRVGAGTEQRPCERIIVSERIYVVPRADGEVIVGATVEDRGFDLRVTAGAIHELLREAYRALPEIAELELLGCAAGLRPTTPDNAPMIGESGIDGLLIAGGHHRNGVLLAPITADAIVAALGGGEMPAAVAGLGPDRFARRATTDAGVGAPT